MSAQDLLQAWLWTALVLGIDGALGVVWAVLDYGIDLVLGQLRPRQRPVEVVDSAARRRQLDAVVKGRVSWLE